MNATRKMLLTAILGLAASVPVAAQHEGHAGPIPTVKPELPRLGKPQEREGGARIRLVELTEMALANNPTLGQAAAEIRAAQARHTQSGLYPNPTVGYTGEEIRGGRLGGGQQGFFVSQKLVTAGKLGLNRKVFDQEIRLAEIEGEEQRLRVANAVRIAYYRVLASQEMLEVKKDLLRIVEESVTTARRLRNTGQADETEVLAAEVEQQQLEMGVRMHENSLRQAWKALAAVVGNPALPMGVVEGRLDAELPDLDEEQVVDVLIRNSPAVRIAQTGVTRAQALLGRERRESIPDIEIRAGLQQNNERLEGTSRSVGLQGFAEVGVQIPLFNRNQGTVEAARAGVERSEREVRRIELVLRERASAFVEEYRNSRIMVEQYRTQLLPRAQKAYELMLQRYGVMTASYPQVLMAQQRLFQMHAEYVAALDGYWRHAITLQGLLLTDGLEAPARPGEMDMPVRETNMPSPRRLVPMEK